MEGSSVAKIEPLGVLAGRVQAVLGGLPQRSALGGVQRKRVELLTLKLALLAPEYKLLPPCEDLLLQCSQVASDRHNAEDYGGRDDAAAYGRARLIQFMTSATTCSPSSEKAWEFIPPEADPSTLLPPKRRQRQRQQIMSLLRACAALMLVLDNAAFSTKAAGKRRAVDFAGGCGHVGVLLAWLFPAWDIVCVDAKEYSLNMGLERARQLGLDNYSTCHADIRDYRAAFDLGIALHACGSASDFAIQACLRQRATLVVAPCCVGKVGSGYWQASEVSMYEDTYIAVCYSMRAHT